MQIWKYRYLDVKGSIGTFVHIAIALQDIIVFVYMVKKVFFADLFLVCLDTI